jgi:hypothetical protein
MNQILLGNEKVVRSRKYSKYNKIDPFSGVVGNWNRMIKYSAELILGSY